VDFWAGIAEIEAVVKEDEMKIHPLLLKVGHVAPSSSLRHRGEHTT
jgi:hypothetical protein